jgi:hypothetical protein
MYVGYEIADWNSVAQVSVQLRDLLNNALCCINLLLSNDREIFSYATAIVE